MAARRKAWDDGAWFRNGLMAYAKKAQARKMAAE
jgi:ring-1,2-phenylacetyl-CoA epoxidase subunit PaaA